MGRRSKKKSSICSESKKIDGEGDGTVDVAVAGGVVSRLSEHN